MILPDNGSKLPQGSFVLRLPKRPIIYEADKYRPIGDVFIPSNEDKKHSPTRVSVFDAALTTPKQALDIRGADCWVLKLSVDDIAQVGAQYNISLEVVYETLDLKAPGAEGHAGIEGLERPSGGTKQTWKDMRQALANLCDVVVVS